MLQRFTAEMAVFFCMIIRKSTKGWIKDTGLVLRFNFLVFFRLCYNLNIPKRHGKFVDCEICICFIFAFLFLLSRRRNSLKTRYYILNVWCSLAIGIFTGKTYGIVFGVWTTWLYQSYLFRQSYLLNKKTIFNKHDLFTLETRKSLR